EANEVKLVSRFHHIAIITSDFSKSKTISSEVFAYAFIREYESTCMVRQLGSITDVF
ncbi:MAG: hypothetical protein ACI9QN_001134, partial [Arcticibacterium sp.]